MNLTHSQIKTSKKEAYDLRRVKKSESSASETRKALTPEARENQLIALAIDLAEEQLKNGTASSQVITHYLKLGSIKEKIEREILLKQKELIEAKTENLQSSKQLIEVYERAMEAMKDYSGGGDGN